MTFLGIGQRPPSRTRHVYRRIWDTNMQDPTDERRYLTTSWADTHHGRSVFHFPVLDAIVSEASQGGRPVAYCFGHRPTWVSDEAYLDEWGEFVTALVRRYRGRITAYGLWNEPNNRGSSLELSGRTLAGMAAIAYPIIKANDPGALVLSPEYNNNGAKDFDEFCQYGGSAHFDALTVHLYCDPGYGVPARQGGLFEMMAAFRKVAERYGSADRPIWNTEFSGRIAAAAFPGSPAEGERDFIGQMYPLMWSLGIEKGFWYAEDSDVTGLLRTTPLSRESNVAGLAWESIQDWLVGATQAGPLMIKRNAVFQFDIQRPGGYRGRIAWHYKGRSTLLVPRSPFRQMRSLEGKAGPLPPDGLVPLSNCPVLIEST